MSEVRVLILRSAGANCDLETEHAWRLAGAAPQRVHVRRLADDPAALDAYQILTIPGGFSYGDDIAAGTILAAQLIRYLTDALRRFVESGKLVLGVCNGFQALVKAGLLPGGASNANGVPGDIAGDRPPAGLLGEQGSCTEKTGQRAVPQVHPQVRTCTIAHNRPGGFQDRWVCVEARHERCPFLESGRRYEMPIAHGEGRVAFDSEAACQGVLDGQQDVVRYVPCDPQSNRAAQLHEGTQDRAALSDGRTLDRAALNDGTSPSRGPAHNPNGSTADIAGLCDSTGRVLGLMPHPERFVDWTQHPCWTSLPPRDCGDGLHLFRRAVEWSRS